MEKSEAIEIVREYYPSSGKDFNEALETLIPELKMSEDERIKETLTNYFKKRKSDGDEDEMWCGLSYDSIIAWSEKQGEHKFPSLSEKEIVCLKRILDFLREEHNSYTGKDFTNEIAVLEWLITHPVLIHSSELQMNQGWQKTAWSEKDEYILEIITSVLQVNFEPNERFSGYEEYMNVDLINWLKSLKERYTWKPSDEQIKALKKPVMNTGNQMG